jgi:hypothetical protein
MMTVGNGNRLLRLLTVFAVAAGLTLTASVAGAVGDATCSSGDVCNFSADSYTGCVYTDPADNWSYTNEKYPVCTGTDISQTINAFENFGVSCNILFYDIAGRAGGQMFATRFALGGFWHDPNLTNNSWHTGGVVENDISSHDFCP